ncbi:MAG: CsbD family protein [Pelagibaca sp.]
MNWDQIKGQWTQMQGEAKRQWGKLTDDDLQQVEGDRDKLVGAIQEKYGKSKEEAEQEVDKWSKSAV